MGNIVIPAGGGGADASVITATAGDVIKGKVILNTNGDPITGTLELTGNAGTGDVLSGKTFYNTNPKSKLTGTMANRGAVSSSLNCGGSYTIPAGYHNGSGKVTANSLASQTGVQSGKTAAGAGQILTGYEAWVNGGRVTGTMPNQGAKTSSLNCGGSYTIPAGYHNGSGKVTANSLASQTSNANAGAGHILSGKTAYVNGSKITGTMPNYTNSPNKVQHRRINNNRIEIAVNAGYHACNWTNGNSSYEYIEYADMASTLGLTAAKLAKGQTVCGVSGTYTSDANASAGYIVSGKTAYVNGNKITGSIADRGDGQWATGWGNGGSGNDEYYAMNGAPEGWYHKTNSSYSWSPELRYRKSAVRSALGITASKILKGQSIAEISGTATSDANAAASNIEKSKTAYVNGAKITGTMETMAGGTYTPGSSDQTISCSGKKMTSNIVIKAAAGVTSNQVVFNLGVFTHVIGTHPYYVSSTNFRSNLSKGPWIYGDSNNNFKGCLLASPQNCNIDANGVLILKGSVNLQYFKYIQVKYKSGVGGGTYPSNFKIYLINTDNNLYTSKTFSNNVQYQTDVVTCKYEIPTAYKRRVFIGLNGRHPSHSADNYGWIWVQSIELLVA